jgi:ABC-type transport system substrate-binding protein
VWIADTAGREIAHLDPDGTRERLPTAGTPWAARAHDGLVWASVAAPQPAASDAGSGTLRIPLVADAIGDADPATTGGPVFDQLAYATCVHLLNHPDAEGAEGRELRPEAAAGMPAVSADGRTYRFRVRRGIRFSPPSGEEVTAETFRHTIERTLSPRLAPGDGPNPFGAFLADVEGVTAYAAGRAPHISGITARGDTLTVRLTRPAGDLPARLALSRFCPVPVGTPPTEGGGSPAPIPMAGPYYVAATGDGQTVVERNPNYTGDRPRRVGRIVYTQGGTAAEAVARVRRGGADYVNIDVLGYDPRGPLAPGGAIDRSYGAGSRAGRAGRPRYVLGPAPLIDGIAFNTRRPLFRDAAMRRAVGYALDRTALAAVYGELPSDRLIPPVVSGRDGNIAFPDRPDLATARHLAGGGRHTARLYGCGDVIGNRVAGIIRANLAPIGIDVRIEETLGCLNGPQPGKLAAADMQLISHVDGIHDPGPFVDLTLGDRYTAPGYWRPGPLGRRIADARALRGAARTATYLGLEETLVRDAAPVAVYGAGVEPEFFSERVGCRFTHGAFGMADLGALCLG